MIASRVNEHGIARVALARADKRNAVSTDMWRALRRAVEDAGADDGVRLVLIESAVAGIFCPGADMSEFALLSTDENARRAMQSAMQDCCNAIEALAKPSIAVIDGACVGGGCSIALACDLRLASERSRFGVTPAKLGLVYGLADTRRLAAAVGRSWAKRMLFTADIIDARQAAAIGLVDEVLPVPALEQGALALAERIAALSPRTHAAAKDVLARIARGETHDDAAMQAEFRAAFAADGPQPAVLG